MGLPNIGREVQVQALGTTWTFSRMDIDVIDAFMDWARTQAPDPFAGLKDVLGALDPASALKLVKDAKDERDGLLDYDSPFVLKLLSTRRGLTHLLLAQLRVRHPAATLTDVVQIGAAAGPEKMREIMELTKGIAVGKQEPQPESGAVRIGAA